jgi:hypothetical protein
MTPEITLAYLQRRAKELKLENTYTFRLRHFVLMPKAQKKVSGQGQRFFLVEPVEDVKIESQSGIFDMTIDNTNELVYEHLGDLRLRNHAPSVRHIRFLQLIPNN